MTISTIVECIVCHSKYNFKVLCDHVMNHREMPIRIGCHNCGNLMRGTISKDRFNLDGAKILQEQISLFNTYPSVGISLELPIVKECYFQVGMPVSNAIMVPFHVGLEPFMRHSRMMMELESVYYPKFAELNTLYNIKNSGNFDVFNKYTMEHFNQDETDVTDTPNKMRLGFVNLYAQLFKHIRSHGYTIQFCNTYLEMLMGEVSGLTKQERSDIKTCLAPYMDLERDYDEAIKVLLNFWNKRAQFYPVMLLLETSDFTKEYA